MAKIHAFFKEVMARGGSDLHLEQGQKPKIRRNGEMAPIDGQDVLSGEVLKEILQEIAPPALWEKYTCMGDIDFAYAMGDLARFRINYYRHFGGIGAVCRIIPSKILTLDDLKAPEVLKGFAKLQSGLVLVTGPTGSGKSTTLAAIINHINEQTSRKIVTIEEPVEFVHPSKNCLIIHREVGTHTDSFSSGLYGAMKSDANVILVGEMRDRETIELACSAAEMGILVFGTLHTNSAAKTVDRIVDVFPAKKKNQIRSVLAGSLQAVVSQQLLRKADESGRIAAYEILLHTSAMPGVIRAGESVKLNGLIQTGKKEGMSAMDDSLSNLVRTGVVTEEAALMKALDKHRFEEMIEDRDRKKRFEAERAETMEMNLAAFGKKKPPVPPSTPPAPETK
ncbi:MAG TPA: PilT/PilU family type 4a pilus ATPase [Candidatus Ozemobacteraceae bacterium]|nr:PilT/PilU family type 4a pilus ATPase [Candidatus Ozemobacteraceae bacterium]